MKSLILILTLIISMSISAHTNNCYPATNNIINAIYKTELALLDIRRRAFDDYSVKAYYRKKLKLTEEYLSTIKNIQNNCKEK